MSDTELVAWVIYENPSDHPGKFVLRRQFITAGAIYFDKEYWTSEDLEPLRQRIPINCVNIGRMPQDVPCIYEVWM